MALKRIGIDLGNFGIKVYLPNGKSFTFEARAKDYEEYDYPNGGVKVLSYEDKQVILGEGDFDNETIKTNRKNLKDCLVGALAQACDDKDEVVIGVGLPAMQHNVFKKKMEELLTFKGDKVTVTYGDPIKDGELVEKTIYIKKLYVFQEGLGSYWALEEELVKKRTSEIIICDIGGRTTDLFTIRRELNGNVIPTYPSTKSIGTLKAYEAVARHFNKLSMEGNLGFEFNVETIENYVENKQDFGDRFDFIDKDACISNAYKKVCDKIASFIKQSNPDYGKALIVIVGGGAVRMGSYVQAHFPDNSMVVDDIYCNAKGYLKAVEQLTANMK